MISLSLYCHGLVEIGKAAETLGVDVQTLRAWEKSGELVPDRRSKGGQAELLEAFCAAKGCGTKSSAISAVA